MAYEPKLIEVLKEIRGTGAPGDTPIDGIYHDLTIKDIEDDDITPRLGAGIYKSMQVIYNETRGVVNVLDEIEAIGLMENAIRSLYADKLTLDSLYADKSKLDSIFADKAKLDSIFNDKAALDSLYADKAILDSIYADKVKLDSIFDNMDQIHTVETSIGNVDTVAINISNVNTTGSNIADVSTVATNIMPVTTAANLEAEIISLYTDKDNINLVADNMDDVNIVADNMNYVTVAGPRAWEAEAERRTAENYATTPENVYVEVVTSNGDGTFTSTTTTDYSSLHWSAKAYGLVTDGIIDDTQPLVDRTYSSSMVEEKLVPLKTDINSNAMSIAGLVQSVLGLSTSTAQGQLGQNVDTVLTTSEQVLPFVAITQSTDTGKFSIGTNDITIYEAGTYNFISTVTFEDSGANGSVGTVVFNLRDTANNTLYYTQSTTVEISNFDRDTVPFNSLVVIPDTITFPVTIDINVSCNVVGYTVNGLSSVLSLQGGSVQTISTIANSLDTVDFNIDLGGI